MRKGGKKKKETKIKENALKFLPNLVQNGVADANSVQNRVIQIDEQL